MIDNLGSTQIWVGYGCPAESFEPPYKHTEEDTTFAILKGLLFKKEKKKNPISTFNYVKWDA